MRVGIEFSKTGMAKYISHLDLQRAFGRALRRSGLPVKMSQGFNPHYIISFASALAVGTKSEAECVEIELIEQASAEFVMDKIKNSLPPGITAKRAVILDDSSPKLMAALREAGYLLLTENCDTGILKSAVYDIMSKSSIMAVKKSKGAQKEIDIRPLIISLETGDNSVYMRLAAASSGSLRPEFVIEEIKKRTGNFSYKLIRTGLFAYSSTDTVDLLLACARKDG